jgi:DNA adenine methylase
MIARPALRYYGGKWRLAPWIVAQLPAHTVYVEPFAGGASVLFQKRPSPIEVYNDRDGAVVAFFRCLRDRPEALIRALELTPYARAELATCRSLDAAEELERARQFYVCCWQSFLSFCRGAGGWRIQRETHRYHVTRACRDYANLRQVAERLATVQIECDDALEVIRRYDGDRALFYCDPPYLKETRSRPDHGYAEEMTESEHVELARVLQTVRGRVLLSGYESALYRELYPGWVCRVHGSVDAAGRTRRECLWLSPNCREHQLPLSLEETDAGD